MIWIEGVDNFKIFIDYLNIHSTIKFTSSHSSNNIPFLVSISTELNTKPTDKHQYLLYSSCHPLHTKKTIPFSLTLCLRCIWSTDATFNTRAAQLTTYLLKRGYNRNFFTKQIRRSPTSPADLLFTNQRLQQPKRTPFITTFNPSLPHISNIIKKHYNLLLSVKNFLAFTCSSLQTLLRDLSVTANLPSNSANPQVPSGSLRCGKNCVTCPYISHGLTTYILFR